MPILTRKKEKTGSIERNIPTTTKVHLEIMSYYLPSQIHFKDTHK
jgi:hypothetical protein